MNGPPRDPAADAGAGRDGAGPDGLLTDGALTDGTVEVSVARVLRAHGVRGHLAVLPLTDEPADRLAAGRVLVVENPGPGVPASLEVLRSVVSPDRVLLSVAEINDRDAAERLRGAVLISTVPIDRSPADPEEFYDHQLLGLAVVDTAGTPLGTVSGVTHGAQDLLRVATGRGGPPVLVPFVAALVPEVDPAAGRVVVDPPPGLFDDGTEDDSDDDGDGTDGDGTDGDGTGAEPDDRVGAGAPAGRSAPELSEKTAGGSGEPS